MTKLFALQWKSTNFVFKKINVKLSDGVTGNTSGFGPEESRFEPWSDSHKGEKSVLHFRQKTLNQTQQKLSQ